MQQLPTTQPPSLAGMILAVLLHQDHLPTPPPALMQDAGRLTALIIIYGRHTAPHHHLCGLTTGSQRPHRAGSPASSRGHQGTGILVTHSQAGHTNKGKEARGSRQRPLPGWVGRGTLEKVKKGQVLEGPGRIFFCLMWPHQYPGNRDLPPCFVL